ncbi:MAG: acyltransferase family protein [Bacteroidaceae bacterium]|nr:acyltransferase family protein [Bacteroidaceae bacterium]
MKQKKFYFDALRLLATFAVVVIHTSSSFCDMDNPPSCSNLFFFTFYHDIASFAVPVFVMISGALFLSPERDTSYPILLRKYVRRIVLALVVFGLPMCLMEAVFSHEPIAGAFCNLLVGHSWTHMWYLYMLIGLYMLTPFVKPLIKVESRRTVEVVLLVLFLMSSVLPMLKGYGVPLEGWMLLGTPFIFYYILGYYLAFLEELRFGPVACLLIFLLLPATVTATFFGLLPEHMIVCADVPVVIGAAGLFLFFKRMDFHWPMATACYPYCFAIYLVHPFFINVARKVLHVDLIAYAHSFISVPVACVFLFALSLIVSWVLRKIPFMQKVV